MTISSKELSRSKVEKLVNRWTQCRRGDFTEQDTATNFILPFLECLGWNIYDVYEVKQQGYPVSFTQKLPIESRPLDKPDCIISLNDNPCIVFEFKPLADGGVIDRYKERIKKLQEKARNLNTRYAILTNFSETIVYGKTNEKPLIRFSHPTEYLSRFEELWKCLSKANADR